MTKRSSRLVRLGALTGPGDSQKWAELLESAYRCARWRWWDDKAPEGTRSSAVFPTTDRIYSTIEYLRANVESVTSTGGLTVEMEEGSAILYVDKNLAKAPDVSP